MVHVVVAGHSLIQEGWRAELDTLLSAMVLRQLVSVRPYRLDNHRFASAAAVAVHHCPCRADRFAVVAEGGWTPLHKGLCMAMGGPDHCCAVLGRVACR
jgi:hypothetical protein